MSEISTKPYLIRAIYDWCTDNGYTPYLSVKVTSATRVPMAYVKNGEIVLNISMEAVQNLQMGNEEISCAGRFGGLSHQIVVPINAVSGIFAKETGHGLAFQETQIEQAMEADAMSVPPEGQSPDEPPTPPNKPHLRVVK